MRNGHDPVSELKTLMARSRQLLGELRALEQRLEQVARRIAERPGASRPVQEPGDDDKGDSAPTHMLAPLADPAA